MSIRSADLGSRTDQDVLTEAKELKAATKAHARRAREALGRGDRQDAEMWVNAAEACQRRRHALVIAVHRRRGPQLPSWLKRVK